MIAAAFRGKDSTGEELVMRFRTTIATCVTGALVASGALAGQAFAEAPEFGRCVAVPKGTGNYSTSKCTSHSAGGTFEWLPGAGAKNKFTVTNDAGKSITLLETVKGTKLICTALTAEGEYTGPTSVELKTRLNGCKTSGGQCNSAGAYHEEIVLEPLQGVLGVVKKGTTAATNKVGLDFSPTTAGGPVVQFECIGLLLEMTGSVISRELKTNAMLLSPPLKFAETKGKQKPESFEGLPRDVLETSEEHGTPLQSGFGLEAVQTNEEKIEINTVV